MTMVPKMMQAGGLQIGGQPGLHRESQCSLGYLARPYLKKKRKKENIYFYCL
jgi:hypothetical protein